jgi:hypothetical protein
MDYMSFAQKIHLKSSLVGFTASKLNLIIFLAHISIILWVGLNIFRKYLTKNIKVIKNYLTFLLKSE